MIQLSQSHNEVICDVMLRSGWLIDEIGFVSSAGKRFGPWGNPEGGEARNDVIPLRSRTDEDGGEIREAITPRFLAYLRGSVVHDQESEALFHVQFVWGYFQYDTES